MVRVTVAPPPTPVTVAEEDHNGDYPFFGASATDLINYDQATLTSLTLDSGSAQWDTVLTNINDGIDPGGLGWTGFGPTDGAVVTAVLNTGVGGNARGYDITNIVSLTSNSDGTDRISQKCDVAYHVVGGGWNGLAGDSGATVNRPWTQPRIGDPDTGDYRGEMKVTISGMTLTGVDRLRFTFYNNPNTAVWREIDVFGSATGGTTTPTVTLTIANDGNGNVTISGTVTPSTTELSTLKLYKSNDLSLGAGGWSDTGAGAVGTSGGSFYFAPAQVMAVDGPQTFYKVKP
jgi:hypothetical protein